MLLPVSRLIANLVYKFEYLSYPSYLKCLLKIQFPDLSNKINYHKRSLAETIIVRIKKLPGGDIEPNQLQCLDSKNLQHNKNIK